MAGTIWPFPRKKKKKDGTLKFHLKQVHKAKKNKSCLKAAARICFSVRVWFSKIQGLNFFCLLNFFFQFFMNLLVKIYRKRYDRHNETLWTTDFFNSVFYLVSCSSKNQVPYFKDVTDSNLTRLLLRKKKKKKKTLKKKKNAFRSGLPICHKLWDIPFIFFSLMQYWLWDIFTGVFLFVCLFVCFVFLHFYQFWAV